MYNKENYIDTEEKNTIYQCSSKLEDKGYFSNKDGLYCPLKEETYLKISRGDSKYCYNLVEYQNDTITPISMTYSCKEAITEEKGSRTKKLNEYWCNNGNSTKIDTLLSNIAIDLMQENNYSQINQSFDIYEKEQKESQPHDDSLEKEIERRINPQLNFLAEEKAQEVEEQIKENGLISYLDDNLDKLHIGKHTNIYRKILGAFKIMKGEGSYIFETIARAGEGKSLEDDIVFNYIIPKQYVYKVNSITKSSFTRYGEKNEYYFDRKILLFGDFGSSKSFGEMEELLNILKVLITEKEYIRDLSDKADDGNYSNKQLKLKVNSIGGVYSSVINDFTNGDSQLESRTISCTPYSAKESNVMDFMILLEYEDSQQNKDKRKAEAELKHFQKYLLKCVTMDLTIINPYGEVFKRYALHSDVPKRELKQVLELFDAYCKLTYFDCTERNDHLVASEKQINDFMEHICLENALIPYESEFLKMLMAEDKGTELKIIDNSKEDKVNPIDTYYTSVLESLDDIDTKTITSFSDLNYYQVDPAVKRLLKLYKLGGTSSEHKEDALFRISDIRRHYSKYKAYTNIDNVQTLIHRLVKKGYIDSLEYQDGKQNIYYLTEQCNDIISSFKLTDEYKELAEAFLEKIGVV